MHSNKLSKCVNTKRKMCRDAKRSTACDQEGYISPFKNEVDYLTEAARQLLLQEAGIVSPIGASQALAMKAGLAIPWTKLRCLRSAGVMYTYM